MTRALLTVSGTIPVTLDDDVLAGRRPRADYRVMAAQFDADVIDVATARAEIGPIARLTTRVFGAALTLAWACFRRRHRYAVVFTDSELVGLPYAALCRLARRRPRHVMIAHRMSVRTKVLVHRLLRLHRRIDDVIVYASTQGQFLIDHLGYAAAHVHRTPFMVDTAFWDPAIVEATRRDRPMICSAGQELRDYPTLIAAVRGLDVDVVLAAASPWSRRANTAADEQVPANVTVTRLDFAPLRQLYADAALVIVPVVETDFQAGITTILEAMAMGRAVICTRTTGQADTVIDGVTGLYVDVGDALGLRRAIQQLVDDPAAARRLGTAARQWVVEHADIDTYAARLAAIVSSN